MPICCSCNSSGRCRNCSCVKAGRACSSCLPSRLSRCENASSPSLTTRTLSQPAPRHTDGEVTRQTTEVHTSTGPLPQPPSWHLPDTQSDQAAASYMDVCDQAAAPYMDVCDRTDPGAFTDLPPFNQMTPVSFTWGESMSGEDFIHTVTSAYAEVVHWCHNLFLLPSGRAGK